MNIKKTISNSIIVILAFSIIVFFAYKRLFVEAASFNDYVFATQTIDGQQDNVIITPQNEMICMKTYQDIVEVAVYRIKGEKADHYFFNFYRIGSFPFGLRYFKDPEEVYTVEVELINKEGESFPKIGTKKNIKIVLFKDSAIFDKRTYRIVHLSDIERQNIENNILTIKQSINK